MSAQSPAGLFDRRGRVEQRGWTRLIDGSPGPVVPVVEAGQSLFPIAFYGLISRLSPSIVLNVRYVGMMVRCCTANGRDARAARRGI